MSLQARYKENKHNSLIAKDPNDYFNPKYNYLKDLYRLPVGWPEKITRGTLRFLELSCIWYPINFMTVTMQHEIFGHGYRLRELGPNKVVPCGYSIQFKIDKKGIGIKEACTFFKPNFETLTPTEKILITIGGCEATSILAHNITMSWLEKGEIDGRQASLWQRTHFELYKYIATLKKLNGLDLCFVESGHDIANYIISLNVLYPSEMSLDDQLKSLRLKSSLSIVLNPFTYLTLYSQIAYILFNSSVKIPGFHDDDFYFLPGYKLSLSPYGPENIIEFFCWSDRSAPTHLYIKKGSFSHNDYFGIGGENRAILKTAYGNFGLKADLWVQPKALPRPSSTETGISIWTNDFNTEFYLKSVDTGFSKSDLYSKRLGGAFSIIYRYGLKGGTLNNTWVQIGCKTKGFLPGEPLRQSPIIKLGISLVY